MAQPTSTPIPNLTPQMGAADFAALPVGTVVRYRKDSEPDFLCMKITSPEPFQNSAAASGNGGVYAGTSWDAIALWVDDIGTATLKVVFQPKVV